MFYGIYSEILDNKTTVAVFRGKRIPEQNFVPISHLIHLEQRLVMNDKVFIVDVNRFPSISQLLEFAEFCHRQKVSVNFMAQPYLNITQSRQWKGAIIKLMYEMLSSVNNVKADMRQHFKMSDAQWRYVDSCLDWLAIITLSGIFSSDGILAHGK